MDRTKYTDGKFGKALYLTGKEYAKFPLDNFNVLEGTVEFYINPDWSKDPFCNSCEDPKDHTIFRAFNNDGYSMSLFMTGVGLRVYLTNGDKHYFLTDSSNSYIELGKDTHVAVTFTVIVTSSPPFDSIVISPVYSPSFFFRILLSTVTLIVLTTPTKVES